MSQTFPRRIDFEGAVNFRDIGGYPAANGRRTRWRRVFRSDDLGNLSPADRERLVTLGVRTLVDFRLPAERHQLPNRLSATNTMRTVEIGFIPAGVIETLRAISLGTIGIAEIERAFIDQYRRFVTDHGSEFARALSYASNDDDLPLIIHCTSGKDRTGFAISVLLMALGTPQETILEDYALTNAHMRDIAPLFSASAPAELIRFLQTAQRRYLEAAFDQIVTSFGSIDAYLAQALNIDDARRARLIGALTEEA